MLFNSVSFLVFFTVVFCLDRILPSWKSRKLMLLVASYCFYAAWNPPFVVLLWISTVVDWQIARWLAASTRSGRRHLLLLSSLTVNLGLLGFFKYGSFLLESLATVLGAMGHVYQPASPDIVLPIGISFYTFQTLSYTLDVYHRRAKPTPEFLDFALYVTFFPQLVAGPIVRSNDFLPQCLARTSHQSATAADDAQHPATFSRIGALDGQPSTTPRPSCRKPSWALHLGGLATKIGEKYELEPRRASRKDIGWGSFYLILGLFEKVVLADRWLAPVADAAYGWQYGPVHILDAWVGTLAFSTQIFCDFAGYSTCAIGIARCLGFRLPENFRFPYAAVGLRDFWRRWHVSLSTWLRDYLYVPLGGNRHGARRTAVNIMITMLLGGLWHGAAWTFVAWGALHGLYLVTERWLVARWGDAAWVASVAGQCLLGAATHILILLTWVFFRATDFGQAAWMVGALLGWHRDGVKIVPARDLGVAALVAVLVIASHIVLRLRKQPFDHIVEAVPTALLVLASAGMVAALLLTHGESNPFIYFQF